MPGGLLGSFSSLIALEVLDLEECSALSSVEAVASLPALQHLCLRGCDSLTQLPAGLSSLGGLTEVRLGALAPSQQLAQLVPVQLTSLVVVDEQAPGVEVYGWAWQDRPDGQGELSHAGRVAAREHTLYYYTPGQTDARFRLAVEDSTGRRSGPASRTVKVWNPMWADPELFCEISAAAGAVSI
jgi:hypothetical protein